MKKKFWIALLCMVLVLVPSVAALAGTSTFSKKTTNPEKGAIRSITFEDGEIIIETFSDEKEVIWYDVNANGEIYGTITALEELEEMGYHLDLAYAQNEEGVYGYHKLSELGFWLETDEEVTTWRKQQDELTYVNLYDSDGETILGQFRLTGETVDVEDTGFYEEEGAPEKIEITRGTITQEDGISYEYWYAFNKKGEAYGNIDGIFELYEQGTSLDQLKEALVEITGGGGVRGYAKCSDLGMWQNDEEAQDWMDHLEEYERMEHPLYAADGETVIGTWKFSESSTLIH
ncbi:MAG: hypothetical protein IJ744_11605 [Lachnospiraceae bacterium]|nr:hypothetical protein [Lachnospiraceae bacterium]